MQKITIIVLVICVQLSLNAKENYRYSVPEKMQDSWSVGSLASQKIDSVLFYKFMNSLPKDRKHKVHSFLLAKDSVLVFEEYFSKQKIYTRHDLRSATKSITSLLIGIAIDHGFVKSIDEPIYDYLKPFWPNDSDDTKQHITIRHVLTMSSGLACDDWDKKSPGQEDKMYRKKDWIRHVLDLPMEFAPGDTARYCTGGVVLLGEILHQATGLYADAFAAKYLFKPLGIENYNWSYIKKSRQVDTGGHIFMTPRDMLKIGRLVLNKGEWHGQRIVSRSWIETSIQKQIELAGAPYGFLWWRLPFRFGNNLTTAICARGNGGQYIIIVPDAQVVAVFTGGNYNSPNAQIPLNIMGKVVMPSLAPNDMNK